MLIRGRFNRNALYKLHARNLALLRLRQLNHVHRRQFGIIRVLLSPSNWIMAGIMGTGVTFYVVYDKVVDWFPDWTWAREVHKTFSQYFANLPQLSSVPNTIFAALPAAKHRSDYDGKSGESALSSIMEFITSSSKDDSKADKVKSDGDSEDADDNFHFQIKLQKEIERLDHENKELRRQILLMRSSKDGHTQRKRKEKKSVIELYSEVLDSLAGYDSVYEADDHLPRVVVVGDQSAGKTSALEMIARARIFPRGAGQMMTRCPVMVTLSEGPYHIATIDNKEFDLTKPHDMKLLRSEIERRMTSHVGSNLTVSEDVVSLRVQGPGIPRMVLVDLPGVISLETEGMAPYTKQSIIDMSRRFMSNPNAIILCIQDASVDAERSLVTQLVSEVDPIGKRTIFALTKVDIAEEQQATDPSRIKSTLEGRLFPMKALGYFAVVTGAPNSPDANISTILEHEEKYFAKSYLFKSGLLKASQLTTRNLSVAVSDLFWKMVRGAVEQQADGFRATKLNLEAEWANTFGTKYRSQDREELFERGRSEVLDDAAGLFSISSREWESILKEKLRTGLSSQILDQVYIPSVLAHGNRLSASGRAAFNTSVDIRLREWAERALPLKSIEIARDALVDAFVNRLKESDKTGDSIMKPLRAAVGDQIRHKANWDPRSAHSLRVMQTSAMDDRSVPDNGTWQETTQFMENLLQERVNLLEAHLQSTVGPTFFERWTKWRSRSEKQNLSSYIHSELQQLLIRDQNVGELESVLPSDELSAVRKSLLAKKLVVTNDQISEIWHVLYRRKILNGALQKCRECRRLFFHYRNGHLDEESTCDDVLVFYRMLKMLQTTSAALRQHIMSVEARRLDRTVKGILDDISDQAKADMLVGRRVELAEHMKRVQNIQEKLDEFIEALKEEK